jgi:head-tail adaptor
MRISGDVRDHPHEDVLAASRRHRRLEPIDIVAVVDDDQTDSMFNR